MTDKICLSWLLLITGSLGWGQQVQKGPYTVTPLAENVYHIEDANDSNPAGTHLNEKGEVEGQNNCSDIYLVTGGDKALLIDLSNPVRWDTSAETSLRSIVYERAGEREFLITATHRHGDHLGMLPAFVNDPRVRFWIPAAEFRNTDIFPRERTTWFEENASIDLGGGYVVRTLEVPGHTRHSTLFLLKDRNLVFTGDAIGSGSGVWLFDYDSFLIYEKSVDRLIRYLEDPANGIDTGKLVIHGGHSWQKGEMEALTMQYLYDMQILIDQMELGTAETEEMSTFIPFLDTNFRYGTATITWNREAAERVRVSQ